MLRNDKYHNNKAMSLLWLWLLKIPLVRIAIVRNAFEHKCLHCFPSFLKSRDTQSANAKCTQAKWSHLKFTWIFSREFHLKFTRMSREILVHVKFTWIFFSEFLRNSFISRTTNKDFFKNLTAVPSNLQMREL